MFLFLCLFSGESEPPWNEFVSYGCWNQAEGASQQTHPKGFVFVFFLIIVFVFVLSMNDTYHIAMNFQFPTRDFVVMLFHYDGVVDDWKQYPWNEHAIHVSVMNQTKWFVLIILTTFIYIKLIIIE